jgi:penicillin-binding protein 2
MRKRIAIKNHHQEIQLISRQSIICFILMLILIGCLITRLGYLQFAKHELYSTLSQKNSVDLVPLEPTRGLIYDRNGVLLAENIPVYSLDLFPYKINSLPKMLAAIAKIIPLTDNDIAQFQRQLKQHRRFDEVTLKLRLSESEVARFAENQYRFPGLIIKARLIRHYPFNDSFSHVLGYVGRINTNELNDIDSINYSATNYIGKLGIEKSYEDELHGNVGYEQAENDASGEPVRILNEIKPVPGKNLFLTIDSKLQLAAEKALAGHRGAVVVIQPSSGEILALVSGPSYDPNVFVDGINTEDYQKLQHAPDQPLFNRAIRGLYPLASTVKPFIALEGLDSGVINPNATIFDPGWYRLKHSGHIFHDWWRPGHGNVNLAKAIISSCDTYFYDVAYKLGIDRIDFILHQFGFGEVTGLDVDEEVPGIVASPAWKRKAQGLPWYEGDTINSGIGQGYMLTTPLQLSNAVSVIANRGGHFTPHLLLAEGSLTKNEASPQTPLAPVVFKDHSTWDRVISAMQGVITSREGTGGPHFGKIGPYTVAAKTGTAQVFSKKHTGLVDEVNDDLNLPEALRDHSWLVAFAPVDKPQVAIAVLVEHSKLAGTVARQILDYYILGKPVQPEGTPAHVQ